METRSDPFFAVGGPKSGTTFLQRTLDLHPMVSCPSEQKVGSLRTQLEQALDSYEKEIQDLDMTTGGQGHPVLTVGARRRLFKALLRQLSIEYNKKKKPIHGVSDNDLMRTLRQYDELFQNPLFVFVVRNPVDIALSSWRHLTWLAQIDPANRRAYLAAADNPRNSLEGYVEMIVNGDFNKINSALAYAANRENFHVVRYEDLIADKKANFKKIFSFLGAETDDVTIRSIARSSTPEAMAATSQLPGFFGIGSMTGERVSVSDEFRREMMSRWLTPLTESLGYAA